MTKAKNAVLEYWPILVGVLLAGMWLGRLQMQVSQLQTDHEFHYGQEQR